MCTKEATVREAKWFLPAASINQRQSINHHNNPEYLGARK
jgi:hypothetical protein